MCVFDCDWYINRFIEFMDCCCGGTESTQNHGDDEEELVYTVSQVHPCRDTMFQHPRITACDLLFQLPSSMPLDSSGYYIHISNSPFIFIFFYEGKYTI